MCQLKELLHILPYEVLEYKSTTFYMWFQGMSNDLWNYFFSHCKHICEPMHTMDALKYKVLIQEWLKRQGNFCWTCKLEAEHELANFTLRIVSQTLGSHQGLVKMSARGQCTNRNLEISYYDP
jgi:hypothetical protein